MAHIVVLGAGTGGMPAAYELHAEEKQKRLSLLQTSSVG